MPHPSLLSEKNPESLQQWHEIHEQEAAMTRDRMPVDAVDILCAPPVTGSMPKGSVT